MLPLCTNFMGSFFLYFTMFYPFGRHEPNKPQPEAIHIKEAFQLKINCGGGQIVYDGATFDADQYFLGDGKTYSNPQVQDVKNTDRDVLYRSERSAVKDKRSFGYAIPVSNGVYEVKLHFAEIYWDATGGGKGTGGKRIFSTALEGQWLLSNYDINADVGSMAAVTKTYTVDVVDGELNMEFFANKDQPKISAFEIEYTGPTAIQPGPSFDWQRLTDAPSNKIESQCLKADGKLYLLSGFTDGFKIVDVNESYDPTTDAWAKHAPMSLAVTHAGFALINNEIWIIAGFKGDNPGTAVNDVQIYNLANDTWREGPALPGPYAAGAAVFYNAKLHYFGGLLPDRQTNTGNHYVLDINDQQAGWRSAAPLPNPRCHLSAVEIDGIIYAMGGQHGHDNQIEDQKSLEAYDPSTDTWTEKRSMPYRRSHFEPGTFVLDGQIVIVGGRDNDNYFYDRITVYDPQTDLWREAGKLPYTVVGPSAKMFDRRLVVSNGGERGDWNPTVKTWATDFWINEETLGTPNHFKAQNAVSIYPNPVGDQLHIIFKKQNIALTKVVLTDLFGKVILRKEVSAQAYKEDYSLDMAGISAGVYLLTVQEGESK